MNQTSNISAQAHAGATPLDPLQFAVAQRDADTLTMVREALAAGRAQLAYQPVLVANQTSQIAFYEGLIRLRDDGGRVLPAAQFMPVIEETGLGREIDAVTLFLAFKMLRENVDQRLSINVSARSLADSTWRSVLDQGLSERGALGDRLIFEISETTANQLHEVVGRFMETMQPKGVAFALDGFGAVSTSFRNLKSFFFDMVKIDKSYARGIADDPDQQVIAEALTTLAHQFEMFVVADGVESGPDATFLQSIGVDCLQGYHFGAPRFQFL